VSIDTEIPAAMRLIAEFAHTPSADADRDAHRGESDDREHRHDGSPERCHGD
jgi:hypothetical protein